MVFSCTFSYGFVALIFTFFIIEVLFNYDGFGDSKTSATKAKSHSKETVVLAQAWNYSSVTCPSSQDLWYSSEPSFEGPSISCPDCGLNVRPCAVTLPGVQAITQALAVPLATDHRPDICSSGWSSETDFVCSAMALPIFPQQFQGKGKGKDAMAPLPPPAMPWPGYGPPPMMMMMMMMMMPNQLPSTMPQMQMMQPMQSMSAQPSNVAPVAPAF